MKHRAVELMTRSGSEPGPKPTPRPTPQSTPQSRPRSRLRSNPPFVAENREFQNHQDVVFCNEADTGLRAIIAIHDTSLGPALGGTRMWPYESETEALEDVLRLSSSMTLKNALAGVAYGGGKAVIIGDPKRDKTPKILRAYGRFIAHFDGRFITGEDVGIGVRDADFIAQVTPHIRGTSQGHAGDPSTYTAYGVYQGIRAAVEHRFHAVDVHGLTVSIQGLGAVGMKLAKHLHRAGAQLIVSDIREEAAREAWKRFGAQVVSRTQAHSVDVDIYAPCAMGGVLDRNSIAQIRARIVAGSANNQLARPEDGAGLQKAGILYAPDYVINAGGVISIAHDNSKFDAGALKAHVAGIGDTLREIFQESKISGLPTSQIADEMARLRLKKHDGQNFAA